MKRKYDYALSEHEGSSQIAKRNFIVAHSTATPNGEAWAVARNMKRGINTSQTYTHLVIDDDNIYHMKKTMSQEEVGEMLMTAYANSKCVSIQLKELDPEGKVQPDIEGKVQGYNVDNIIVSGNPVNLDEINHVELI